MKVDQTNNIKSTHTRKSKYRGVVKVQVPRCCQSANLSVTFLSNTEGVLLSIVEK